ncbi:MAG: hypothetical protein RIB45_02280 [Marivibrio sp.]|uniref:hypothetical protein n=1 Tax=Marivibrio sp. TaxID=2039719 RepID=UPI0032EDF3EA
MTLYLDLDGVLADFDAGVAALGFPADGRLNKKRAELTPELRAMKTDLYDAIERAGTFFLGLPPMEDAEELWRAVQPFEPWILTAPINADRGADHPAVMAIAQQKLAWVRTHLDASFPDERFACVDSGAKALYVARRPGVAILVDDRPTNIAKWHEAGGLGVHHTSAAESIATLTRLIDEL